MKNPFLIITVFFILGLTLGMNFSIHLDLNFMANLGILAFLIIIAMSIFYLPLHIYKFSIVYTWLILKTFLLIGIYTGKKTKINPVPKSIYQSNYISVIILSEPINKVNYQEYLAQVVKYMDANQYFPINFKAKIYLSGQDFKFEYGKEYILNSQIKELEEPLNPAEFNFKKYLNSQNIWAKLYLSKNQILYQGDFKGSWIIQKAQKIRENRIAYLNSAFQNAQDAAFLSTLILGYRVDLDKQTTQLYTDTGTIHALSVSGMHVGLIYLIINIILERAFKTTPNVIRHLFKYTIILILIWMYTILCGLSAPTLRACIMISFFLISKIIKKNHTQINILSVSAFIQLVWNPFTINDIGFQLSYLAVLGLILYHQKITSLLKFRVKKVKVLWENIALSLSTQITTFPLGVYYFNQFPLLFILGNLLIAIPIALIMYLGLLALVLELNFLSSIISLIIKLNHFLLQLITRFEYAVISQISISFFECILLYTFMFCLIKYLKSAHKVYLLICFVHAAYLASISYQANIQIKNQRLLIAYSLGNKKCIAFISQSKAYLISDLDSNSMSIIQFKVKPALDSLKVKEVITLSWTEDYQDKYFNKHDNLIVFRNKRILILNYAATENLKQDEYDFIIYSAKDIADFNWLDYQNQDINNAKTVWIFQYNPIIKTRKINTEYYVLEKNKAYLKSLN